MRENKRRNKKILGPLPSPAKHLNVYMSMDYLKTTRSFNIYLKFRMSYQGIHCGNSFTSILSFLVLVPSGGWTWTLDLSSSVVVVESSTTLLPPLGNLLTTHQRAQKLMGENVKIVWVKFSTLRCFCYECDCNPYPNTLIYRVENSPLLFKKERKNKKVLLMYSLH